MSICGICQTEILASEKVEVCSKCSLPFHHECWLENKGCAAYGCENVSVLAPPISPIHSVPPPFAATNISPYDATTGYLLLALAAVAALFGLFTFGIPTLIALGLSIVQLTKSKTSDRTACIIALTVSAVFFVIGLIVSISLY